MAAKAPSVAMLIQVGSEICLEKTLVYEAHMSSVTAPQAMTMLSYGMSGSWIATAKGHLMCSWFSEVYGV